jgi:hypothetical protein
VTEWHVIDLGKPVCVEQHKAELGEGAWVHKVATVGRVFDDDVAERLHRNTQSNVTKARDESGNSSIVCEQKKCT